MATDWLFVGATLTFITSTAFNALGFDHLFEDDILEGAKSIFFFFVGALASLLCGWQLMASDYAMALPVGRVFFLIGILDFIFALLRGMMCLKIYREDKRAFG